MLRHRGLQLWIFAALLVACAGTGSDQTAIRVVLDSDLLVGTQLTKLLLRVVNPDDNEELHSLQLALTDGPDKRYTLPTSVLLKSPDNRATRFLFIVTGRGPLGPDGSEVDVVRQQILASFRPHFTQRLDMFLSRSCLLELCDGTENLTCDPATGHCGAVSERTDLPVTPGDYHQLDASATPGGAPLDGGTIADPRAEGGSDTSTAVPCPTGQEALGNPSCPVLLRWSGDH